MSDRSEFIKYIAKFKDGEIDKNNFYKVEHYHETLWELAQELKQLPLHCFDGRYEDIFFKCLNDLKYEVNILTSDEVWNRLIELIYLEFKKIAVPNILLLPLNFLKGELFENNLKIFEHAYIFLPTIKDLKNLHNFQLLSLQQKKKKGRIKKDELSLHVENTIFANLDKEHILLSKDKNFFNYPILAIDINNVDAKVENESGRIVEGVYSIIRMIDLKKDDGRNSWGVIGRDWSIPANTYVVYYNEPNSSKSPPYDNGYGYSFRYNFEPILDVDTFLFMKNIQYSFDIINTFISSCFLNYRNIEKSNLDFINKWKNAILMFNTAYEFASIEKYDSAILMLISILESLFVENKGIGKKERLALSIKEFFNNSCSESELENVYLLIKRIYDVRNNLMHEGKGYESNFSSSRRLHDYQGTYKGMRPFSYKGSFRSYEDLKDIKDLFLCVIDIVLSDQFLNKLKIIDKIL